VSKHDSHYNVAFVYGINMRPIDRWVSRLYLANGAIYTLAAILCSALSFQPYCDNQVQLTFVRNNASETLHSSKFHTGLGFVIVLVLSAVMSFVLSRFTDDEFERIVRFVQCEHVLTVPLMHACIAIGVGGSTDVWTLLSIMAAALLLMVNIYTEWQISVQSIVHSLLIATNYIMLVISATDSGRARLLFLAIVAAIVLLISAVAVSGHAKLQGRVDLCSIVVRTTSAVMIKVFITMTWAATCVDFLEVRAMVGASIAFIVTAYMGHLVILGTIPPISAADKKPPILGHDAESPYSDSVAAIDETQSPYSACPTGAVDESDDEANDADAEADIRKLLL